VSLRHGRPGGDTLADGDLVDEGGERELVLDEAPLDFGLATETLPATRAIEVEARGPRRFSVELSFDDPVFSVVGAPRRELLQRPKGLQGQQGRNNLALISRQSDGPLVATVFQWAFEDPEALAIRFEAGGRLARTEGRRDGPGRQQQRIHHGHSGQALFQQGSETGLLAGGAHHDVRAGIEKPHLQGCFEIGIALRTQQQNGSGLSRTSPLQNVGQPHVTQRELGVEAGLHLWGLPAGRLEVKAAQRHIEIKQALQACLAERTKTTDQHR
jgi:hypothetical protein